MSELVVETPEGVALRYEIAGAGTRILAAAVDGFLWAFGLFGLSLLLLAVGLGPSIFLVASGAIVALVLYSFLFSVLWDGRTPGKFLVGVRVCDEQGFSARPTQHLLRALFVPLESLVLAFPLPLVWVLLAATPRHQRLGDLVAGTLVLRDRERALPPEPAASLRWSELPRRALRLGPVHAARFDGEDLAYLRDLLTRIDLERGARERLHRRTARLYAERLGLPAREWSALEARAFLRELFLFLREMRGRSATRRAASAAGPGTTRASGSPPR